LNVENVKKLQGEIRAEEQSYENADYAKLKRNTDCA